MTPSNPRRRALLFPVIAIAVLAALSAVVMALWNAVLTPMLHLPLLDYPRAAGLLILCRILFGGWGRDGSWRRGGGGPPWRQKWSGEERDKFREEWRRRCAERKGEG